MKKFHYNFNGAYNKNGHSVKEIDSLTSYVPISVWDDEGHELTYHTNIEGYGLWDEDLNQIYGTAQWCLPYTVSACRKWLREALLDIITEEQYRQALQEQHAEEARKYEEEERKHIQELEKEIEQRLQEYREKIENELTK